MRIRARWASLSAGDRKLLIEATGWLLLVRLGLRLAGFDRVRRWAARPPRTEVRAAVDPARVAWAIGAAARRVARRDACLAMALAAQAMLARRGCISRLQLGVRRGDTVAVDAHAWLECNGAVLVGDADLHSYEVLRPEREVST